MEDDEKTIIFSDALFTHIWRSQNITSKYIAVKPVNSSEFVEDISRSVLVLSSITASTIDNLLKSFFDKHTISRVNVFTFLTAYCFEYHFKNGDIFEVILSTCTFVYKTMLFCYNKGEFEYVDFASMCWVDIFNYDLRQEFYDKGGWQELERYVKVNCNISKDAIVFKDKYISYLNDINNFFQSEYISHSTAACCDINVISNDQDTCNVNPVDHELKHFVSANMCEANITTDEALYAYELLTNYYGQNCAKLNGEQTETSASETINMKHVYKTLTNFINLGILEVGVKSGKFMSPNLNQCGDMQNDVHCCANYRQQEPFEMNKPLEMNNDMFQTMMYLSTLINKIIRDNSNINFEELGVQSKTE